jgi:hypothetical protein
MPHHSFLLFLLFWPEKGGFRIRYFSNADVLMTVIAGLFGVVTENAFPLREIPPVDRLLMRCPPSFYRSVEFRGGDTSRHHHGKRAFTFDFRLLNLLTAKKTKK